MSLSTIALQNTPMAVGMTDATRFQVTQFQEVEAWVCGLGSGRVRVRSRWVRVEVRTKCCDWGLGYGQSES